MKRIMQAEIYKNNMHSVFMKIYKGRRYVFQKEIPYELRMSNPTMREHLTALEKEGLIYRNKVFVYSYRDNIGRRPMLWAVNEKYRVAVGVEICAHAVEITAVSLYGEAIKCERLTAEYENSESYYENIAVKVKEFISSLEIKNPEEKILGIGFALQGIVSKNGDTVTYGELLKCTGLKIDVFSKRLNYPCRFVYSTNCAALSELWLSPQHKSLFYLSMSEHLSGALAMADDICQVATVNHSRFEHITACKDGEMCYCGKRGCYETVLSKVALLRGDEPEEFFRRVRNNEPQASERWGEFLRHLGKLIAHLHLVADTKYILGGHLAPYFTAEDIGKLYEYGKERTPFAEGDDYILPSKMPSHNITIGAALPYIMGFLENVPDVKP